MMHRLTRVAAAVTMVTLLATAAGCGTSTKSKATGPDKVTYITAYGQTGRDAFAWVAQEKGYFKKNNLDVKIQPGAAASTNLKELSAGQAQFAALDFTGAMIAAGKSKGQDFQAIAAIHQKNLSSVISLPKSNITTPKDLEGKTLVTATGGVGLLLFPAYAKLAGIDPKKVTFKQVATTQVTSTLVSGQAQGAATFLIGAGGIKKAAKVDKVNILPYSNYLTDVYGNALITSPKLAKSDPDEVKRFRDAMLEALAWTIKNPQDAAKILGKYNPTANTPAAQAAAVGEITSMAPYVDSSSSGTPIGAIDQQRVARSIALLEGQGLIPAGSLTPNKIVDFAVTPKA
jgi:NitT/TauT family transport system substrate-binding protein